MGHSDVAKVREAITYLAEADGFESASLSLPPDERPVVHEFGAVSGVVGAYALEPSESPEFVTYRHLMAAGVSEHELAILGLQNLVKLCVSRPLRVKEYFDNYVVLMGGTFEASVVLLHNVWEKNFRKYVKGEYAIAFPDRDILSFCDASSERGMAQLRGLVERSYARARPSRLSPSIYIRRDGKWCAASS